MTNDIVVIESPYAPTNVSKEYQKAHPDLGLGGNIMYARMAMKDCLLRGESPYASHLLYTQKDVLDDNIPDERQMGIEAGFTFRRVADKTVVYYDRGVSTGMEWGISHARAWKKPVEYRSLLGTRRVYLAGPMEFTEDGGKGWRQQLSESVDDLQLQFLDPCITEEAMGLSQDHIHYMKANDPDAYIDLMRNKLQPLDLELVYSSDFIVIKWEGEMMSGTVCEAFVADKEVNIPVYLVTSKPFVDIPGWFVSNTTERFEDLEALTSFLRDKWSYPGVSPHANAGQIRHGM